MRMGLPGILGLAAYDHSDTEDSSSRGGSSTSSSSSGERELRGREGGGGGADGRPDAESRGQRSCPGAAAQDRASLKRPRASLPSAQDLLEADEGDLDALRQAASAPGRSPAPPPSLDWKQPDALGRVRSFAPEEGSYATTVMIPVLLPEAYEQTLRQLLAQLQTQVPGLHPIGFGLEASATSTLPAAASSSAAAAVGAAAAGPGTDAVPLQQQQQPHAAAPAPPKEVLHLSLSRTLPLRFHLVSSLVQELKEQLKECQGFSLRLASSECLVNDERTRSFVAISMQREDKDGRDAFKQVCQMIRAVNAAFHMHGLEAYYKDPRPHVSVAWVAGDQERVLQQALQQMPPQLVSQLQVTLPVSTIVCRLGQREHVVWTSS